MLNEIDFIEENFIFTEFHSNIIQHEKNIVVSYSEKDPPSSYHPIRIPVSSTRWPDVLN